METVKNKKRLSQYLEAPDYKALFPESLNAFAVLCSAAPGEILIHQGDEPSALLFLVRGRCSVSCILPNGKTILLKTMGPSSVIGEMELICPERSALTVTALERCELLVFPMQLCRNVLPADNAFLRKLCILIGNKERQSVLQFLTTSGYPLDKRLAAFILEQREGDYFRVRKVTAAQSLGVSYRHLETVLNRFVDEGILSKEKRAWRIEKEAVLQELAGEMMSVF